MAFAASALAQGVRADLVAKHSVANDVPEALVRRVIRIESNGNPGLISRGNYGLMQIRLKTAREMGYDGGPQGLLDADTNMKYAVKYLARAYRTARCNPDRAITLYQHGYIGRDNAKCESPAQYQVAQAESKLVKMPARASGQDSQDLASDALKPKVVHTVPVSKLENAEAKAKRPLLPAPALTDPVASDPVTGSQDNVGVTAGRAPAADLATSSPASVGVTVIRAPAAVPASLPPPAPVPVPEARADSFADRIGSVSSPPQTKRDRAEPEQRSFTPPSKRPDPPRETRKRDIPVETTKPVPPVETAKRVVPVETAKPALPVATVKSDPVEPRMPLTTEPKKRRVDPLVEARSSEPSPAELAEPRSARRGRYTTRRYRSERPEPTTGLASLLQKIFTPEKPRYRRVQRTEAVRTVRDRGPY
jgi:hypothetical protein